MYMYMLLPAEGSTVRKRADMREDLPAPERPTTPTLQPAGAEKDTPLQTYKNVYEN